MINKIYLLIAIAVLGLAAGLAYYPQFFSLSRKNKNKDFYRQPAAVIRQFSAEPAVIAKGQSSVLSWSAGGGEDVSCFVYDGTGRKGEEVGLSGKKSVSPESTTTYTLKCFNEFIIGSDVTKEAIVKVRFIK